MRGRLSLLLLLFALLAAPLLLPAAPAVHAAFGDDPHTYGQTLVYDNVTANPAPGDFWNGGYNGYPAPNGLQLSPGMYLARADWSGSNLIARLYTKAGSGPCTDSAAGVILSPDDPGSPDASYFSIRPVEGGSSSVPTTLCTYIYINWSTGISVRLRIYRVFPGAQVDEVTNAFQGEYPVDGLSSQLGNYQGLWFDQPLDVVSLPLTVTLDIDWKYHTGGRYTGSLDDDPDSTTNDGVNPNNCVLVVPPAGTEPYGPDRVCPGQTVTLTNRIGTWHFRISGYETTYAYIFRLSAHQGSTFPTMTPTPSATPTPGTPTPGTPTPAVPPCEGGSALPVRLQGDGGSDYTLSPDWRLFANGGRIYVVVSGSPVLLPDYSSFPNGYTLPANGAYHFYATEYYWSSDPAVLRVCPLFPTATPTVTSSPVPLPTCVPASTPSIDDPSRCFRPTPTPTRTATTTPTSTPTVTPTGTPPTPPPTPFPTPNEDCNLGNVDGRDCQIEANQRTQIALQQTQIAQHDATPVPLGTVVLPMPAPTGSANFATVQAVLCEREPCHGFSTLTSAAGTMLAVLDGYSSAPVCSSIDFGVPSSSSPLAGVDWSSFHPTFCWLIVKFSNLRSLTRTFSYLLGAFALLFYLMETVRRLGDV